MLSRLAALVLLTTLVLAGCQGQDGSYPAGPGKLRLSDVEATPESITEALTRCVRDPGLQTAALAHFKTIVGKKDQGESVLAEGEALILWLLKRYSQSQWSCDEPELDATNLAIAEFVGLNVPEGAEVCDGTEGCKIFSPDACAAIQVPVQTNGGVTIISFEEIEIDPFLPELFYRDINNFGRLNSFARWFDLNVQGFSVTEFDPPATAAVWVDEYPIPPAPIAAVEARLYLFHKFFNVATNRYEVEILEKADQLLGLAATCNQSARSGWKGKLASLFLPANLIANPGETGGKLSPFGSPLGAGDGASNTQTAIEPNNTVLDDKQTATLTATVTTVAGPAGLGGDGTPDDLTAGDPLEFLVNGEVWSQATIDAAGQASLQLKCGVDIGPGTHTVDAHYLRTERHAESWTTDQSSPTGSATVVCNSAFTPINFDRDPDGRPIPNRAVVNTIYQSLGVTFSRFRDNENQRLCGTGNDVYAVTDPAAGNFSTPPRGVSLCASGDSRISAGTNNHGWVQLDFEFFTPSTVCVDMFPTTANNKGTIVAYKADGTMVDSKTQPNPTNKGATVCVSGSGIRWVRFSGDPGFQKFDTVRFAQ